MLSVGVEVVTTSGIVVDEGEVMVTAVAAETLVPKIVSPEYCAAMAWPPTAKELVEKLAVPALSVPVPSVVKPSTKVTVPVGVPAGGTVVATVAVKVSEVPTPAVVALALKVVVDNTRSTKTATG